MASESDSAESHRVTHWQPRPPARSGTVLSLRVAAGAAAAAGGGCGPVSMPFKLTRRRIVSRDSGAELKVRLASDSESESGSGPGSTRSGTLSQGATRTQCGGTVTEGRPRTADSR